MKTNTQGQLTQAKYESNARGEGSDLAPLNPLLPSRIQNISKLQGWKNSSFLQFWLTARISKNIISFIFKISLSMIEGWTKDGRLRRKKENQEI